MEVQNKILCIYSTIYANKINIIPDSLLTYCNENNFRCKN